MAAPFSTPFQILFFFPPLCTTLHPILSSPDHSFVCHLHPLAPRPSSPRIFFLFFRGALILPSYLDIGQPLRPGGKFKEREKKQLPPYIFNHLLTFPLFSQYVFPKLLIKMASTWPTPLYFLSIQRVVKKTWAIRQKETSPYFILADLCRGFKNIKKTPLICVENAELRGKSQN